MKKIILLLFLAPTFCMAQISGHPILELFKQANTPISKKYIPISSFESVEISVLKLTDLNTDKVYGGVRFGFRSTEQEYVNIIDKKELDMLTKTLKKFTADTTINQHEYVEMSTSNGFQFKITNDNELKLWMYKLVIEKNRPVGAFNFGKAGLAMFISKLELAQDLIKEAN